MTVLARDAARRGGIDNASHFAAALSNFGDGLEDVESAIDIHLPRQIDGGRVWVVARMFDNASKMKHTVLSLAGFLKLRYV